ncbi:MAG: hypothetical protein ACRDD9_18375, partial [Shewanella sp.]
MKTFLPLVLSTAVFLSSPSLAGSASQFQLTIPTLEDAANIDGEFDEAVWQLAAQVELGYETQPS